MSARRVVVGVGNAFRGDDGAGLAVVARLDGRLPAGIEVVATEQEPTRLMDAWEGAELVFVIDAVESGAAPGTVHRFDATEESIPARVFRSSTHAFGVGDTIEVARALGTLPPRVVVYGIEGESFDAREGLSPAVAAGVEQVAASVLADLSKEP